MCRALLADRSLSRVGRATSRGSMPGTRNAASRFAGHVRRHLPQRREDVGPEAVRFVIGLVQGHPCRRDPVAAATRPFGQQGGLPPPGRSDHEAQPTCPVLVQGFEQAVPLHDARREEWCRELSGQQCRPGFCGRRCRCVTHRCPRSPAKPHPRHATRAPGCGGRRRFRGMRDSTSVDLRRCGSDRGGQGISCIRRTRTGRR